MWEAFIIPSSWKFGQQVSLTTTKKNIKYLPQNLSDQVDHNRNYNNYENSYSTP